VLLNGFAATAAARTDDRVARDEDLRTRRFALAMNGPRFIDSVCDESHTTPGLSADPSS
jgi:hypothetical protein